MRDNYGRDSTVGLVWTIVFSICNLILLIQVLVFRARRNKFYKLLDEGYYFIEEQIRWNKRKMFSIHPSNVDASAGVTRVINPAMMVSNAF